MSADPFCCSGVLYPDGIKGEGAQGFQDGQGLLKFRLRHDPIPLKENREFLLL